MEREIEDDAAADGVAGDRCAGAAAGDGHTEAARNGQYSRHFLFVVGEDDGGRDEPEERGIGGVRGTIGVVDAEITDARGAELFGECSGKRCLGLVSVDGRPVRSRGMGHSRHVRIVPPGLPEHRYLPRRGVASESHPRDLRNVIRSLSHVLRTVLHSSLSSYIREFLAS